VLHMINNPANEELKKRRNAKLAALQEENTTLKAQLSILETGEGPEVLSQLKQQEQQKNDILLLKELQQKLSECEKSKARHVEVFEKKVVEFKKAIRQIFGYRIELLGETGDLYRLFPTLTKGKDNFLLFQYNRTNDTIALCSSDYTALWTKEFDFYLGKCDSYPGYMAAITLALLKQKEKTRNEITRAEYE